MTGKSDTKKPEYVDDVTCRDVWCETTQVVFGPAIRIEFCVQRWTYDAPVRLNRVTPVARVAMTPSQAKHLIGQLTEALEHIQQVAALAQAPPASESKN